MSNSVKNAEVDGHYYEVATPGSLAERLTARARDRIYADLMRILAPKPEDTLLDVGISDVTGDAANVLERRYPHPAQLTAAGLGSAAGFQAEFPLVQYRQIVANQRLPFADGAFDIATSNAVLEHVGSPEHQRAFVAELCRVARRVLITVPCRYFPIEHHTGIPVLHWSDGGFQLACRLLNKSKWCEAENLILMSRRRLAASCPPALLQRIGHTGIMLGPFSSNLYAYLSHG